MILNICQNTFDAMREKQITANASKNEKYFPSLTVRSHRDAHHVYIKIEDNGPGIPPEIHDKIMQPFFTTKKGTQGTGLGLSITQDIIKAHGGELKIDSENEGPTFLIKLNQ